MTHPAPEGQEHDDAVRLAVTALNHCPRAASIFPNYLALSLTSLTLRRLDKLGVSWDEAFEHTVAEKNQVWLPRDVYIAGKAIIKKDLDASSRNAGKTRRPCPYCGNARETTACKDFTLTPPGPFYLSHDCVEELADLIPPEQNVYEKILWLSNSVLDDIPMVVEILSCRFCSLNFMNWPFEPTRLNELYERVMPEIVAGRLCGRSHRFNMSLTKSYFPIYVARDSGGLDGRRVFDFGCGEGIMAWYFKQFGANVSGTEINRYKVNFANEVLELKNIAYDPGWIDCRDNLSAYDIIVSFHSLEHLTDLRAAFDGFSRALKQNGLIYIAVPHDEFGGGHTIGLHEVFFRRVLPNHGFSVVDVIEAAQLPKCSDGTPDYRLRWSSRDDLLVVAQRV